MHLHFLMKIKVTVLMTLINKMIIEMYMNKLALKYNYVSINTHTWTVITACKHEHNTTVKTFLPRAFY